MNENRIVSNLYESVQEFIIPFLSLRVCKKGVCLNCAGWVPAPPRPNGRVGWGLLFSCYEVAVVVDVFTFGQFERL
jgi:hypothetical protein